MPRALNFREIEAFRAVMLTGTTTAAAAMLHTTQPSVSRLLTQAQAAADIKLFDMQRGRLRPTAEARRLFDTVQTHFHGLASIEQDLAVMRKSGTGVLRLGCTPSLGLGVLPAVVARFAHSHPGVHVSLQTVSGHQLNDGLHHGRFDLAVATANLDHPQFDVRVVHRTRAVCVMHPEHSLARRKVLHARQLDGQALITLNAEDELSVALWQRLRDAQAEPSTTIETTFSSTICSLAAEGAGIGIVNVYAAMVFGHAVRAVPLEPACPVEISLAYPGHTAASQMAEAFAETLVQHLKTI
jgi:DNA-binding transcriptional LysR family regulator